MFSSITAKLIIVSVVIGALVASYAALVNHHQQVGEDRATASYNKKIDELNERASSELERQRKLTETAQSDLRNFKDKQEITDAANKSTVSSLTRRLRDITSVSNGRLRDPNANEACGPSGSGAGNTDPARTVNRDNDGTKTGGLLSISLTKLLQSGSEEADAINLAYASCRSDARNLREQLRALAAHRQPVKDAQ